MQLLVFLTENTHTVELVKDSSGLGMSVQGGRGWHSNPKLSAVRIRRIYPHTPAAKAPLEVGDVLLNVNGQRLKDKTNNVR